jgi:D-amino-acid dehydrogenase
MKVGIIGAGIIGITTAWELAADGHEVTVFERRGSVAAESSFANAGVMAPGGVVPWGSPAHPARAFARSFGREAPLRLRRGASLRELAWLWRWSRARAPEASEADRRRLHHLARFSRERLHGLTRSLSLDYERSEGCLVLLRTKQDLATLRPTLVALADLKARFKLVDAAQCRIVEPGLSAEAALHSGVYLPEDEVGNCRQFAALLRAEAQRLGVRFRFHTPVRQIVAGRSPQLVHAYAPPDEPTVLLNVSAEGVAGAARDAHAAAHVPVNESFDAVVVCAALDSVALLRPLGLKLPMQAIHGYSVTAPVRRLEAHGDIGPRSAVIDHRHQVVISRLGARLRVAGIAEIGGSPRRHDPKVVERLYEVLQTWFPGSARLSQAQVWKGARPMLPDGAPALGASGIEGVWLNLGHGASGWALACGSARVVADAVAGRTLPSDAQGLSVERWRR